jgi:Skp family chaperone for outer membrane proteins
MNARSLLLAGLAVCALIPTSPVAAQTARAAPPSAPTAPPLRHGAAIAGYCVFSLNEVIGGSKVGQAVVSRLKVLGSQVNAELEPEATGIQTDERALESQQASLDAATVQAKRANLELRISNFQKREQLRQQEIQATQQKQFGVIVKELDPIVRDVYQQRNCSILVDADQAGVRILNPAMDLSPQFVAGLDGKIQTLTFDREHLDQPGAAPAAAR